MKEKSVKATVMNSFLFMMDWSEVEQKLKMKNTFGSGGSFRHQSNQIHCHQCRQVHKIHEINLNPKLQERDSANQPVP